MASATTATLSWLHSFRGTTNETAKLPRKAKVFKVIAQKKARKTRKIIMKEDVEALGKKGRLLDVKAEYFRNYLQPMGKAQIGTPILLNVAAQDLVDIFKAQLQRDVDKRIVYLPEIRETGEYIAELKLHPEVTA